MRIKNLIPIAFIMALSIPSLSFGAHSFTQYWLSDIGKFPTTPSIVPNETNPALSLPILAAAPPGALVAVGTERAFAAMAASPQLTHLLMVDSDPNVILFNRFNLALLKIANGNRELYLHLRLKAMPNEILSRAQAQGLDELLIEALRIGVTNYLHSKFSTYYHTFGNEKIVRQAVEKLVGPAKMKEVLREVADGSLFKDAGLDSIIEIAKVSSELTPEEREELIRFGEWARFDSRTDSSLLNVIRKSYVSLQNNPFFYPQGPNFKRLNQRFQISLNPVFKGMNYLYDETLFQRLTSLAIQDRIVVLERDLGSAKDMIQLASEMRDQNIRLSVLDISNAWEANFMPWKKLAALVESLQLVAQKTSLLMISDSPNYDFNRWSYYGYTFANIPRGDDRANEYLSAVIAKLPGTPALGLRTGGRGARPHVAEKVISAAYIDNIKQDPISPSKISCDATLQ